MTTPKHFKPKAGPTEIADTQPRFALIAMWGGVWTCAPVSERPEVVLIDWHVFEVNLPCSAERTRHFAGQNTTDCEGRVSSAIVTFDGATARGITQSGRVYQLQGSTCLTGDGEYTWNRWKSINSVTDVVDVTAEIKALMEQR
ncbi:hypothetical protein [Polaromonas sp.]|uniref:hypothetical protein n=1 Tax=Polaromonas sp. TaxID=1869339 RepID=UPI0017A05DBB|nr:hypothetical protein [Polaromonas sp.]NMM06963.1 hypothetical protein [Polaromonas sp.]